MSESSRSTQFSVDELAYGVYAMSGAGELTLEATGQCLKLVADSGSGARFRYADAELSIEFSVELTSKPERSPQIFGREALLDLRQPEYQGFRTSYGLWRRVSWFLLDSVLVWLEVTGKHQDAVVIRGGWLDGEWEDNVRLRSSVMRNGGTHRACLPHPIQPYGLVPLDKRPPRWAFMEGLPGAREAWIKARSTPDGQQIIDETIEIDAQLQDVPRFVCDDGSILFFNRVIPNVGPEYAPAMAYGLLSESHVHYFGDRHGSMKGTPIRRNDLAGPGYIELLTHGFECEATGRLTSPALHPTLRERQFFAGFEARNLIFGRSLFDLPEMAAIENGQTQHFGSGFGQISDAPICVGLPLTRLASWPRLADERRASARTRISHIDTSREFSRQDSSGRSTLLWVLAAVIACGIWLIR